MPEKAVCYYRMSDDRQENSIERQRSQVEPYAAVSGYRVVSTYTDLGISGDEIAKRPQFRRMLDDARAGKFDVILVDQKSRFGRFDAITYGYVVHPLREAGIKLVSVADGVVDWNSFAGRLVDAIGQETNQKYVVDMSRAVLSGMANRVRAGEWPGGPVPYAYRLTYKDGVRRGVPAKLPDKLLLGPAGEVETVRLIFDLYAYQ